MGRFTTLSSVAETAPEPPAAPGGGGRSWWAALAALVALRVAIPLVALVFSGHALPGLPLYRYQPLTGDSEGFYAAAREFISSVGRASRPLLLLAVVACAAACFVALRLRRGSPAARVVALLLPAAVVALALTLPIHGMHPPGAAVFGWPLLLSIPLFPLRVVGWAGPDMAFAVGLAISLVAIAVTVVATAYVGLYATGRRAVGIVAAGLVAAWPLASGQLAGHSAWENGSWTVDVGLALYTEPLSTALVVTSVVLLLRPATGPVGRAAAGLAIGFATVTKLTNGVLGLVLAILVAWRQGVRAATPYAAGALVSVPLLIAYWPKGYVGMFDGATAAVARPWSIAYVDDAWRDSLVFTPRLLLILAPLLVVGCFVVSDRRVLAVVSAPIVVGAVTYSFYYGTDLHPRFLYSAMPFVFVLEAAGALAVVGAARRRRGRGR